MTSVWFVRQFRQNGEVDDDAVGKWLDEGWAGSPGRMSAEQTEKSIWRYL